MCFVRSLVPNRADAEEVLQNVNLFLWRNADEFTPGTNFVAWAFQIARFEVLTYRKRMAREKSRFSDEVVEQLACRAERLLSSDSRLDALEECMRKLPEKDRHLVMLRYELGATTKVVSEQTGRSVKAIYEALNRIRSKLMKCVDGTESGEEDAS
jgi:RNA polymerase sigma-70 factor (ECF subfamily)